MRNREGPRGPRKWPKQHERQVTGKRGPLWAPQNRPKNEGPRNRSSRPQGSHSNPLGTPTEHRGNLKTTRTRGHSSQHFYYHRGGVRTRCMQSTFWKSISRLHTRPPMGRGGMSQSPNSTRGNDRGGNSHDGVKLGNAIFVTKCWGARRGEGQRIVRMKYLFTNKCSDTETLYPSRTRFTRDTTRVGRSAHEWVRIKGFKTLTTFTGPWGHTVVLGQIRVGPKFRGGRHEGRNGMEGSHNDLSIPKFSNTAHNYGGSRTPRENRTGPHSRDQGVTRDAWCGRGFVSKIRNIEPHPITPSEGTHKDTEIPKSSSVARKRVGHASQGGKWGSLVYRRGGFVWERAKGNAKGFEIRYSRPILVLKSGMESLARPPESGQKIIGVRSSQNRFFIFNEKQGNSTPRKRRLTP
jgi:hypothetical protein